MFNSFILWFTGMQSCIFWYYPKGISGYMVFSIRHSLLKLSPLLYITDFLQLNPCFFVFQYCYANLELSLKDILIKIQINWLLKFSFWHPLVFFEILGGSRNIEVKFNGRYMFLQIVERRYDSELNFTSLSCFVISINWKAGWGLGVTLPEILYIEYLLKTRKVLTVKY